MKSRIVRPDARHRGERERGTDGSKEEGDSYPRAGV